MMMDINQCIDQLGLNTNTYRLDKSDPPHKIIEWTGSDPQPTQSELENAWTEIEANSKATKYQRDRKPLYGTWEEQLDMMYHGTWKDHVAKVKADIPKGNS